MKEGRIPLWFWFVIIVACLPAFFIPFLPGMVYVREQLGILSTLYPVYVAATALCALMCYKQRREVAWILVGLMVLAHVAMFFLCSQYS